MADPTPDPFLLDIAACNRAVDARDRRFDGLFFVAIRSTRIYCRPHCPSRLASPHNRRFFATQVEAEREGFRPCLRCRPELAPGRSSIDAVRRLARTAARRIAAGALNGRSVQALAQELGVSERQVRRALVREFGVSPLEFAQTHRLLLAKQLLAETRLSITQVAYASGFQSLRRFNALVQQRYRVTPGELRRRSGSTDAVTSDVDIELTLDYRPPYDWPSMLAYLAARALPGVESVTLDEGGTYRRVVALRGHAGRIEVRHAPDRDALRVVVSPSLVRVLAPLLARLRRVFDLDAEPAAVASLLARDPTLAPFVERRPGLRVPGAMQGFEVALRALVGRQSTARSVSIRCGRLVREFAERLNGAGDERVDAPTFLPLTAAAIVRADPRRMRACDLSPVAADQVLALARTIQDGELPELTDEATMTDPRDFRARFLRLPGVTAWAADYVMMRALAWPDAFPETDPTLQRAAGVDSPERLRARSETWRPWRAYAAQHLWAAAGAAR